MRLVYVLLSPTLGMHQYTADLANRMASAHDVHVITTKQFPADRYCPDVMIYPIVEQQGTGFSVQGLQFNQLTIVEKTLKRLKPDVVHFTGPHIWNLQILRWLKKKDIPTLHTIHDLDPHQGTRFSSLLKGWNKLVLRWSNKVLVHGKKYQTRLIHAGSQPNKIIYLPLLHLFLGYQFMGKLINDLGPVDYQPYFLYFGRLEEYKGLDYLIVAFNLYRKRINEMDIPGHRLILAGPGKIPAKLEEELPTQIELRNHQIDDLEGDDLFRNCSLVVLPYIDGTQSAVIGAAYFYHKPVIATDVGALAEYVIEGQTGYIVPARDPISLADCFVRTTKGNQHLRTMGEVGRAWYDDQRRMEFSLLTELYFNLMHS